MEKGVLTSVYVPHSYVLFTYVSDANARLKFSFLLFSFLSCLKSDALWQTSTVYNVLHDTAFDLETVWLYSPAKTFLKFKKCISARSH